MGRFFFGPAGDRPDHGFFGALAETQPGDARRRTRWLWRREFSPWFERSSVPTKAWLGALDRLVSRGNQKQRFSDLAAHLESFAIEILAGAGHVVTDTAMT